MKKIILILRIAVLLFLAFSGKAQETLIVRGYLGNSGPVVPVTFRKSMFCYLKGNYVTSENNDLYTFTVDSVISGSFRNFNNEVNQPPFDIIIALINECTLLPLRQNYVLRVKQFPRSNYYYTDSLAQVFPDYSGRLVEYYNIYQRHIDILTKGSLEERRDFLSKLRPNNFAYRYVDYRYIPYILPFMTSRDSVSYEEYIHGEGIDDEGFMLSWIDHDFVPDVLRSVLIDKSGKQSDIINVFIASPKTINIYNIEFDKNTVDIYLFDRSAKTFIRKRINKKEYGL